MIILKPMEAHTEAKPMTNVASPELSDHSSGVPPKDWMMKLIRPYSWLNIQLMVMPTTRALISTGM